MLKERHFPDMWKRTEVVPVKKLDNPTMCKDFRSISLLYHRGKVAEYFFIRELEKYLTQKHTTTPVCLPEQQRDH